MVLQLVKGVEKEVFNYNPREFFSKDELISTIADHKYILPFQDPNLVDIVTGTLDFLKGFQLFCSEEDIHRRPIQEMNGFIFGKRSYLTSISAEQYWQGTPFRNVRTEIVNFYSIIEEMLYSSRLKSYSELTDIFDSSDFLHSDSFNV